MHNWLRSQNETTTTGPSTRHHESRVMLLDDKRMSQQGHSKLHLRKFFPPRSILVCLFLLIPSQFAGAQAYAGQSDISSIESALRRQDPAEALRLAQSRLIHFPNDFKTRTLEGLAYSGLGKGREALVAYKKALAVSPDYLPALEGAAQLEYEAGNDDALRLLTRILKLLPNDSTSNAMVGVLAYKQHDCASAVDHFQKAAAILPSQPEALVQYASCLMDIGRARDAVSVLQQLVQLQPEERYARYDLAVAQYTAHDAPGAIATLQPLLETGNPDPDLLDLAAAAREDAGDTPAAVNLLRKAIVASPRTARYYLDFASLSLKHSSFDVGIDVLDVGIKQMPDVASLYIARGILYVQEAQFEKAEADFETATRLDPSQTSGSVAKGLAQIQESDPAGAEATVERELRKYPEDPFLYYLKADALTRTGGNLGSAQHQEAVVAASKAVTLKPDFVMARDLLAKLYLESGQLGKAEQQSRLALRDNPSDQEALFHLIQALRKSHKADDAEIQEIVKKLADLRDEDRKTESADNKYRLYEPDSNASSGSVRPR